jgi:hypothetical protein
MVRYRRAAAEGIEQREMTGKRIRKSKAFSRTGIPKIPRLTSILGTECPSASSVQLMLVRGIQSDRFVPRSCDLVTYAQIPSMGNHALNSSSSDLASFRSAVSKPSVNQL